MEEELELSKAYDISMDGYEGTNVSLNRIIGSSYFDDAFMYDGDDLGATYTKEKTGFKVWGAHSVGGVIKSVRAGGRR